MNKRCMTQIGCALILTAVIAGCGAKKALIGDPETGITLRYALEKGETLNYQSNSEATNQMEMMGQSMDINNTELLQYSIDSKGKNSEGHYDTEITLTEANITISGAMGEQTVDLSGIINKPFGLVLSQLGEEIEYIGAEDITYNAGQMAGGEVSITNLFENVLSKLPEKSVKIGDTWTESGIDTIQRMGMETISDTKTTWKFEGVETVDGDACIILSSESESTVDGTGQQMGMDVAMEGDMSMSSTVYFDYNNSRLVKSTTTIFMEATIAMTGQTNMTIPLIVQNQTELKLIK